MGLDLRSLDLRTLAELKGGLIDRMIRAALNRMAMDCESAPDIGDYRKVTLTIRAKPVIEDGELSEVIHEFEVNHRVPARVTSTRSVVKRDNTGAKQFFLNLDSPDSPDQQTLLPVEEREVRG